MGDIKKSNSECLAATPFRYDRSFYGFSWDIADRDVLVELVAEILITHHNHVLKVLHGAAGDPPPGKATVIHSILDHVLAPLRNEQDRYQRDGLLFQHISWIAAASRCESSDLLSTPHTRKSDKGQDMLIVHLLDDECSVTIGEDKATINARETVRDKVYPEFTEYETGSRDNELESATLAILQRNLDSEQSQEVINKLLWERARRYRISVSACTGKSRDDDLRELFAGYQDVVVGDDMRRRADTIAIPDLRTWFDSFTEDIKGLLTTMLEEPHV